MDKRVLRERMRRKQQQLRRRRMMKRVTCVIAAVLLLIFVVRGVILPIATVNGIRIRMVHIISMALQRLTELHTVLMRMDTCRQAGLRKV